MSADEPNANGELEADEVALLAAFDRLRPQGSLSWGFDDAMRRIAHPETSSVDGAAPWKGLPDDLWERGRSARIGQRFVGDVAGVLADLLAADSRAATATAVAGVNVATWDALRYLAERVALLEARLDPTGLQASDLPVAAPDLSEWTEVIDSWLGPADPHAPVMVGESGDGTVVRALHRAGRSVVGIEPRGEPAWRALSMLDAHRGTSDDASTADIVIAPVIEHLGTVADRSAAAVVLAGCVDRFDLFGTMELLRHSLRVTRAGGTIVILTTDQSEWDAGLSHAGRDLAPGRPLHPETWSFVLRRAGVVDQGWHQPTSGSVHAIVGVVPR